MRKHNSPLSVSSICTFCPASSLLMAAPRACADSCGVSLANSCNHPSSPSQHYESAPNSLTHLPVPRAPRAEHSHRSAHCVTSMHSVGHSTLTVSSPRPWLSSHCTQCIRCVVFEFKTFQYSRCRLALPKEMVSKRTRMFICMEVKKTVNENADCRSRTSA